MVRHSGSLLNDEELIKHKNKSPLGRSVNVSGQICRSKNSPGDRLLNSGFAGTVHSIHVKYGTVIE